MQIKKTRHVTSTSMGVEKLSIGEIRKMPALMGEVDVIKGYSAFYQEFRLHRERWIGIQRTRRIGRSESYPSLIMPQSYNASHMFGFFSVFNNDVVNNVELYKRRSSYEIWRTIIVFA